MAQHTINLTADRETARTEMGITDVEAYIKSLCDKHIEQQLDDTWAGKTVSEKQTLLS